MLPRITFLIVLALISGVPVSACAQTGEPTYDTVWATLPKNVTVVINGVTYYVNPSFHADDILTMSQPPIRLRVKTPPPPPPPGQTQPLCVAPGPAYTYINDYLPVTCPKGDNIWTETYKRTFSCPSKYGDYVYSDWVFVSKTQVLYRCFN